MPDIVSLKMLGLAGVASYAAARLAAKTGAIGYSRYALVAVPAYGMPKMPRGFTVCEISPEMLAGHVIDVPLETQADRFAQGLTCIGAFDPKNRLIGVNWVGTGPFTESEVHVRFYVPEGTAWDCGLWIAPQYRLGRGFAALWAGTADWLRDHGKSWSMSWIVDYNLPSLLSHRRMQAVTLGYIVTFRLFRWQYMAEGKPKFVRRDGKRPADMSLPHPVFV